MTAASRSKKKKQTKLVISKPTDSLSQELAMISEVEEVVLKTRSLR